MVIHGSPWDQTACKILVGKQGTCIYVLDENGQWTDRQISLLCTVEPLYNGHNGAQGGGGYYHITYMGYIGMCCCEGYGFHAVYSRIGHINQSVWV